MAVTGADARRIGSPASSPARRLARRLVTASAALTGTVTSVVTSERAVALTFDDGPDPEVTPRLCELLEAHGARGTFFMVGRSAARWPEAVARVAAGGHAIGNHSWDHPSFRLIRRRWRRAQIRWCREALAEHDSGLLRPPYGHQSLASQLDARLLGYRTVAWSVMAEDWLDDPPERLVERVEDGLAPGAIVLFHDVLWTALEEHHRDRGPTLEAVRRLLERHAGDWRFVTVPELLTLGRPRREHWYKRADLDWLRRVS
jgi:peptidoglycan/xylan/chitin deacetylase (PgdA/CDA1 family)